MKLISLINPFHKPLAKDIIQETLRDYERNLLEHEAATSYSHKMSEYYREGIKRLQRQATEVV